MKIFTHNDKPIDITGTCYQGMIACTYRTLVAWFGEPVKDGFDDYKSDAEWHIEFDDGAVLAVYNWKNGKNYCGNEGTPTEEINVWNIGSRDKAAALKLTQLLDGSTLGSRMASAS